MGKVKRSKTIKKEALRNNPVGIPSVRSLTKWEEEGISSELTEPGYVQNLLQQIECDVTEERADGLRSLALATDNSKLVQEILETNVLCLAANLLLDRSIIVRQSAACALRNWSELDESICETLVGQGTMKAIVTLFKQKYGAEWKPAQVKSKSEGKTKLDSEADTFVQTLHLLSNLCAASENALKIFNNEGLFPYIYKTLNVDTFGLSIALAGAHCLQAVTEENVDSLPAIAELNSLLLSILEKTEVKEEWLHLRAFAIGVLLNIHDGISGGLVQLVLRTVHELLEPDVIDRIKTFSSVVPLQEEGMEIEGKCNRRKPDFDMEPDKLEEMELISVRIRTVLDAQILAMETLANLVFTEDEESGSLEDSDDDEGVEDLACDIDMTKSPYLTQAGELSECFRSEDLVGKIVLKCRDLPANVSEIMKNNLEFGKDILSKMTQLRSVALLCLQNILQAFDLDTIGGVERLRQVYVELCKALTVAKPTPKQKEDSLDFMESLISAVRGVLQKAIDEDSSGLIEEFSVHDIDVLINLYTSSTEIRMQSNVVRLMGSFGILASQRKIASVEPRLLLVRIGTFLLGCLSIGSESGELARTAETLDTIFDVFAEDNFNDVLQELSLIEKLRVFEPQFKKQFRNCRRSLGDSRGIVDTARTNLSRFIDYKRKLGC